MAVTEVIRFDFFAQAVNGIRSGILRPTFLFEHSPPIVELRRSLSPFDPVLRFRRDTCVRLPSQLFHRAPQRWAERKIRNAEGSSVRGDSTCQPRDR